MDIGGFIIYIVFIVCIIWLLRFMRSERKAKEAHIEGEFKKIREQIKLLTTHYTSGIENYEIVAEELYKKWKKGKYIKYELGVFQSDLQGALTLPQRVKFNSRFIQNSAPLPTYIQNKHKSQSVYEPLRTIHYQSSNAASQSSRIAELEDRIAELEERLEDAENDYFM